MKLFARLFLLVCLGIGLAVTYGAWYGPLTNAAPVLKRYLPSPTAPSTTPFAPPITLYPGTTATPTAAVAPGPASPAALISWSSADCTWAESTMQLDEHLDQQEAWAIAEGFDPRYPNLSFEQAYITWEQDWAMVLAQVQSICTTGVPVTSDHIAQARADFALAIASHQADAQKHPDNAGFDATWIANYTRIDAMYAALS